MNRSAAWFLSTSTLIVASGCGGGGGAATTPAETTKQIGQATISYTGDLHPFVGSGINGVTITGLAGSAISKVQLNPTPTLNNTVIAVTQGVQLYTISNSVVSPITGIGEGRVQDVCFTPDGRIAFTAEHDSVGGFQVYTCNYDGSGIRQITHTATAGLGQLSWAPDNKHVAFGFQGYGLHVANFDGSGEFTLDSKGGNPAFSPDSKRIAFLGLDAGNDKQIFTTDPLHGGSIVQVSANFPGYQCSNPIWSPDGSIIAFDADIGGGSEIVLNTPAGALVGVIGLLQGIIHPRFSPDGKKILYATAANATLTMADSFGETATAVAGVQDVGAFAWSPFFKNRLFVGSGGVMLPNAAGFLWGQEGRSFSSLVAFTATTPSTATITNMASAGGTLVYQIHADSITNLRYSNCYYGQVVAPISPTSATPNALVSFDAQTGQLATIAPLAAGALRPASKGNGVYSGRFTAVWDAHGKNLAPSGAFELQIGP